MTRPVSQQINGVIHVHVQVAAAELAKWPPERIREFMDAVSRLIICTEQWEAEAK